MPKGQPRTFTDAELRRMRSAVETHEGNLTAVADRFGIGLKRLRAISRQHGWKTDGARQESATTTSHASPD